jgi:hypothetical protein
MLLKVVKEDEGCKQRYNLTSLFHDLWCLAVGQMFNLPFQF